MVFPSETVRIFGVETISPWVSSATSVGSQSNWRGVLMVVFRYEGEVTPAQHLDFVSVEAEAWDWAAAKASWRKNNMQVKGLSERRLNSIGTIDLWWYIIYNHTNKLKKHINKYCINIDEFVWLPDALYVFIWFMMIL